MPKIYKSKLASVSYPQSPYPQFYPAKLSTVEQIDTESGNLSPTGVALNLEFPSTEILKIATDKITEEHSKVNDQMQPSISNETASTTEIPPFAVAGSSKCVRNYDPEYGYIIPHKSPFTTKRSLDKDTKTESPTYQAKVTIAPNGKLSSYSRILHDLEEFWNSPSEGVTATPTEDDIFLWTVSMTGPEGSPYEEGTLHGILQIPSEYPYTIPTFTFSSSIFHPNISEEGVVCFESHPIGWSPCFTIGAFLHAIRYLLGDPSTLEPVNSLAANVFDTEKSTYVEIGKQCVNEDLKKQRPEDV